MWTHRQAIRRVARTRSLWRSRVFERDDEGQRLHAGELGAIPGRSARDGRTRIMHPTISRIRHEPARRIEGDLGALPVGNARASTGVLQRARHQAGLDKLAGLGAVDDRRRLDPGGDGSRAIRIGAPDQDADELRGLNVSPLGVASRHRDLAGPRRAIPRSGRVLECSGVQAEASSRRAGDDRHRGRPEERRDGESTGPRTDEVFRDHQRDGERRKWQSLHRRAAQRLAPGCKGRQARPRQGVRSGLTEKRQRAEKVRRDG